jgi:nuclear pore complex protein Nup188
LGASNIRYSSWKSAFSAITSNVELESDHQAVFERFLLDSVVLDILAGPFEFFSEPSPQTKTAFETKTSAINVTPSSNTRYDIKELKEDALWLSKTAKIDEVLALRIVVQEYQSRASAQLQGRFSEEELTNLREAAGNSKYSSQIPVSLLSGGTDPEAIQKEFETEDNRRQRIFYTYLSERRYLLKCAEQLFHVFFAFQDTQTENGKGKGLEVASSWLETIGKALAARMASRDTEEFILGCIKAITTNTQNLGTSSGWSGVDGEREDVESAWARNQLLEATHAMEIIWEFLIFMLEIPSSQVALAWFRLQQGCEFFNNFEAVR